MITVTQYREERGTRHQQDSLQFDQPVKALAHMACYELAFGANIIDIAANRIQLETRVMDLVDTSIFEGTAEEMQPLLTLAYHYTTATANHGDAITTQVSKTFVEMEGPYARTPFLASLVAPLLMGANRLKAATMLAAGITQEDDLNAGLGAKLDDLVAAIQLQADGACTFREALA